MKGRKTFHRMSEMCADPGSFSKTERASRSRTRTRICTSRSANRGRCLDMAPLRSLSPSRGNSTDAISRFLDDNMNKWHTVDILNRTITEEEIEQVHVELPLVRALTIDRTVGFIYYNNNFHLKTFKFGMENIASLLIKAFGSDFANFHDEPNNVSRGIFRAFINGSAKLFHKVASGVDKTSALPLMKFVAIAISFGPDRALFAHKNCDQMWVKFEHGFGELYFYEHFTDNSLVNAAPYLLNLREIFNLYFRDGRLELIDRKSKGNESASSHPNRSESTSTASTPFPRYVGVAPPTGETTINSSRAVSEDSFRSNKSEKSFTSRNKTTRERSQETLDSFYSQSKMIASQSRDATPSGEPFPSPEMTEKWSFSERFPSFHSNLTQKQSEKETPAKEVHFSRPELTERWSPTEYSFSPPRKEQSEDSFGVLLDANDTPNSSNLKEKTGNFDISYGRRDRVSFKEPLPLFM